MVAEEGNITAEQLVRGVSRLKGSARSLLPVSVPTPSESFNCLQELFCAESLQQHAPQKTAPQCLQPAVEGVGHWQEYRPSPADSRCEKTHLPGRAHALWQLPDVFHDSGFSATALRVSVAVVPERRGASEGAYALAERHVFAHGLELSGRLAPMRSARSYGTVAAARTELPFECRQQVSSTGLEVKLDETAPLRQCICRHMLEAEMSGSRHF